MELAKKVLAVNMLIITPTIITTTILMMIRRLNNYPNPNKHLDYVHCGKFILDVFDCLKSSLRLFQKHEN